MVGMLMVVFTSNFFNIIAALITGFLGPYMIEFIRGKLKKKKDPLKEALILSDLINNKMEDIKDKYKCDRIWISQFHNGGHFYPTGKSIQKFSIFYESVGPSISSIQQYFQNIPVHLFSKSLNHLLEQNHISISNFKNVSIPTYGLKTIQEETKSKSTYVFSIRSIENKFIGFVGIDYVKEPHLLNEDEINDLLVQITSIGGILIKHLNSK
jgi:hypothetical protein